MIVFFEMPMIWPSSCFICVLFLVEAGPLFTRLAKSGFVPAVWTLRLDKPTLLVRSLDLKDDRFTLLVSFVDAVWFAVVADCNAPCTEVCTERPGSS